MRTQIETEFETGAWHYILPNGTTGTFAGDVPNDAKAAKEWIGRQHGCRADEVRVRRAGDETLSV